MVISHKPRKLKTMIYSATDLCNSKCSICNIWQKQQKTPRLIRDELSFHEIQNLFQESERLSELDTIIIGGGEPFLKKDLVDTVLTFYEHNPSVRIGIATNGLRTDLIIKKLSAIREVLCKLHHDRFYLEVGVSIDGLEQTHDHIRGVPGIFNNALDTINRIKEIPDIKVKISFTITPENYKEFMKVYQLSCQLGTGFNFRFIQKSNHYYGNQEMNVTWEKEELDKIANMMRIMNNCWTDDRSLHDKLLDIDPYYYEMMIRYERHPRLFHTCYAGTHSFFMDPYGNVYPCIMLGRVIGNVRKTGFDALWSADEANRIRDFIRRKRCYCYSTCEVPHSLPFSPQVYRYNVKKVISHAFKRRWNACVGK